LVFVRLLSQRLSLRGSPAWKAWVEALATHSRLDVAKLIDRALIDFATKEGFKDKAPMH
jgi:hypothetical protein